MSTEKIWPANDSDNIIDVDLRVGAAIRAKMANMQGSTNGDMVWEIVRVAIETDRATRETAERHARGDFGRELSEATELALEISARTDGTTFRRAYDIFKLLDKIKGDGFDQGDVGRLLGLHSRLIEKIHETDELVVKLQGVLLSLKG